MSFDTPSRISSDARTSKLITPASPSEARFKLATAAELLAKPQPEIEWLIENIWVDKSRGLIAGNPGVGKTWLALDMLISVASGQLCLGKYPVSQGAVLLVEEEASELNLSRRLHCMARARGLRDQDLANLFLLTRQFTKIPEDSVELFHLILENDIKLVVFDSLRRLHSADENSSSEMQKVLDSFARLNIATNASIVLIHHLAKGSREVDHRPIFERMRGSGDLWAWRDCILGVEGEEDATEATVSFQFRDAEAQSPIRIKRYVGDTTGAISLGVENIEDSEDFLEKSELILDYMKTQYGALSKEAICTKVKGRKQDLGRVFKVMADRKMVVRDGSKWIVPDLVGTNGNVGTSVVPEPVP